MRLIKRSDPRARNAEPSYSAEATVRRALESNRSSLEGLNELLRDNYTINSNRDILDAVRNGDWVLVENSFNSGWSGGFSHPASEPEPVYIQEDRWPDPKPRTDLIFAKSIGMEEEELQACMQIVPPRFRGERSRAS